MNARYYLPGIGRFVSADTIVPNPADPQSFNRYSYTLNNPIKYSDPSGHCPAPSKESGNIICIAAFIPTAYSEGPGIPGLDNFQLIYAGDNRSFSNNSERDKSRFWVWVDTDSGEILDYFIHPTTAINDIPLLANLFGGECHGSVCTYPQPEWTSNLESILLEDGRIGFNYSVLCSHPSCYAGPGPDGSILFVPDGQGSYYAAGLTEQFPNLEAYYWKDGKLIDTLFQINHFDAVEIESGTLSFQSGLNMYGGIPFGKPTRYWDTFPWWERGHVGH